MINGTAIRSARHQNQENDRLEIATDGFARQVTLQAEGVPAGVFEDNYFDLAPGQKRRVAVLYGPRTGRITLRALNSTPLTIPWASR